MTHLGPYTVVSTLGRGGMGEVFLARAGPDDGLVVLKRVLPELASNPDILGAFLDETRIAARLRHPHLIRIDALAQFGGEWVVRMEYVPGVSLAQLMRKLERDRAQVPFEVALTVTRAVASGLGHAWASRDAEGRPLHVVHRDVSPHNILLGRRGEVKLIDFGVALAAQRAQQLTRPGTVKGKMSYMPPEQAEGAVVDHRSDLFALGVCLWELLTGRPLFTGQTAAELYLRLLVCNVPPPSLHRPSVPPELDALVLRLLAREPDHRFQHADAVLDALETLAAQYQYALGPACVAALVEPFAAHQAPAVAGPDERTVPLAEAELQRHVTELEQRAVAVDAEAVDVEPPLIGRASELADLHQLLAAGDRLITLLGPVGVGKSRLARAVAQQQRVAFEGRVAVVEAQALRDVEGLCVALAEALGVALPAGEPVDAVTALLLGRRRCLVVLDQLEHLQPQVGRAVATWLRAAPDSAWLVASRAALEVAGEVQYVVGPLRLDAPGEGDSDAVALFLQRAGGPSSSLPREAVRELVRRLEGMPLAIELAAAQSHGPHAVSALLGGDEVPGLTGFTDAFELSWRQLSPEERSLLAQCTVFEGGFTAEAAMRVLRGAPSRDEAGRTLKVLHRLRARSLVRLSWAQGGGHDQPRFSLYESIRSRVQGRAPADEAAARARHAEFFLRLGERLGEGAERGGAVLDALSVERENLVCAWRTWLGQGADGARRALRVLLALDAFFVVRGPYGAQVSMLDATLQHLPPEERGPALEARARVMLSRGRLDAAGADLEAVLAGPGDAALHARAIAYLGVLRRQQGTFGEARVLLERALAELERVADLRMQGRVQAHLAAIAQDRGQLDEARARYDMAVSLHRAAKDRRFEAITLSNLATLHQVRGAWKEAEAALDESLELHRQLGNRRSEGIALTNLGDLERDRGAGPRAVAHYQRALQVHREVGNRRFEAICLLNHALVLLEQRDGVRAAALLDEALSLALALGDQRHAGLAKGARGALRAWRGAPGAREDLQQSLDGLQAAGDVAFRAAVEVYGAQVRLADALALERDGHDASDVRAQAAACISAAVAPEPGGSRAQRFEHVRMALRVLKALQAAPPPR